jgi:hypothetical protein
MDHPAFPHKAEGQTIRSGLMIMPRP